jgi:hypothetical protein
VAVHVAADGDRGGYLLELIKKYVVSYVSSVDNGVRGERFDQPTRVVVRFAVTV